VAFPDPQNGQLPTGDGPREIEHDVVVTSHVQTCRTVRRQMESVCLVGPYRLIDVRADGAALEGVQLVEFSVFTSRWNQFLGGSLRARSFPIPPSRGGFPSRPKPWP
jgi:hypothetical protein